MKNVTFLGVEGSGKTVLTTALVNVFKAHEREGWYLRPDSRESFRFLEQAPKSLAGETLPHQTVALKHLAWSVQWNGRTARALDVLDYPGEIYRLAFLEAKDDPDPVTFAERVAANQADIDALLSHLLNSDQVFVLFNLADAENLAENAANLDAVWVTNACLDYLQKLPGKPTVTLLLTQADRYLDLDQRDLPLTDYVKRHLPLIHRNFPDLDVLAVSALGSADSTYGLDGVILRCLFESGDVQTTVREILDCSRQINSQMDGFDMMRMSESGSWRKTADLVLRCRRAVARLPWFIPLRPMVEKGYVVDLNELNDDASLLACFGTRDVPLVPEQRLPWIRNVLRKLNALNCSSAVGQRHRGRLTKDAQAAIESCEAAIERNRVSRMWCNRAIVILTAVAVIEVAVIFGRILF